MAAVQNEVKIQKPVRADRFDLHPVFPSRGRRTWVVRLWDAEAAPDEPPLR